MRTELPGHEWWPVEHVTTNPQGVYVQVHRDCWWCFDEQGRVLMYRDRGQVSPQCNQHRSIVERHFAGITGLPFGPTDCSLPMTWALEQDRSYDTFVIFTDNETWAGREHPHQALARYRQRTGIDARLVVAALTPTRFSIADPADRGMLDVVGLDSAVPQLIADFSRGDV